MLSGHPASVARSALFQPWIHLPGEDWLKLGLLLRDRIDRIIPDSPYVPDLAPTPQLEVFASRGLIGNHVVTYADAEEAQETVLHDLDSALGSGLFDQWVNAGRPFLGEPEYTRIHTAKIGRHFALQLERRGIWCHRDGHFLYSEPAVGGLYMFRRNWIGGVCRRSFRRERMRPLPVHFGCGLRFSTGGRGVSGCMR